jgi:hypothetical protein
MQETQNALKFVKDSCAKFTQSAQTTIVGEIEAQSTEALRLLTCRQVLTTI